ncbi:MAG: hypothetical protein WDN69_35655 [Aliidongia sp.]
MADRHAFLLEDAIIVVDPLPGLGRIDEGEGQRADAVARRQLDRLAVGAGDPDRRMRLLHRLRHDVAAGHFEIFALMARIRRHHHHVEAMLDRFGPGRALVGDRHAIAAQLHHGCGFACAEFDPAVRDEI